MLNFINVSYYRADQCAIKYYNFTELTIPLNMHYKNV